MYYNRTAKIEVREKHYCTHGLHRMTSCEAQKLDVTCSESIYRAVILGGAPGCPMILPAFCLSLTFRRQVPHPLPFYHNSNQTGCSASERPYTSITLAINFFKHLISLSHPTKQQWILSNKKSLVVAKDIATRSKTGCPGFQIMCTKTTIGGMFSCFSLIICILPDSVCSLSCKLLSSDIWEMLRTTFVKLEWPLAISTHAFYSRCGGISVNSSPFFQTWIPEFGTEKKYRLCTLQLLW